MATRTIRDYARGDLFFLLFYVLQRHDVHKPWILARCKEVQEAPDGYLDLWSREHYKSTIITFGKTIQDLLVDPNRTFGIFSHTRPMAKDFLRQIKREFEGNTILRQAFPEIIWEKPERDAPKWSEDEGIILRRSANPKEASVEAWGVVDGQPIGKHFWGVIYDDVVVKQSTTTPEMLAKTTEMVELSYSLGSDGGVRRAIGTRYHFNDAYRTMIDRGSFQPRIRLATHDGTMTGDLALWSRELLHEKRRDFGPYTFACFTGDTPVLMADFSQCPLANVFPGDEVIGFTFGDGKRASLVKTEVLAKRSKPSPVVRFRFASGREIVGTRDHKFWHGRSTRGYSPLGFSKQAGELAAACSVYDPRKVFASFHPTYGGYLAGMFDGEGSVSAGTVHLFQSISLNPGICERIGNALALCGIAYGVHAPPSYPTARDFFVKGGRQGLMCFMHVTGATEKRQRLIDRMLRNGTRNLGKGTRDKLVAIEDAGEAQVWDIQTGTGNYIAAGYAVSNCQIMQNPVADDVMGFKREWLLYYDEEPMEIRGDLNVYLLVDAANSKKKGSDYTVMWAIGLGGDQNAYVLDIVRDRLNLTERAEKIMTLHRKWKPIAVRYETYGMQGDVEHITHVQKTERYRFHIDVVGGQTPKNDRIRRLMPWYEAGRFYFPKTLVYRDYEGVARDMVTLFLEDEFVAFPVAIHDDMLDSLARLLEPDIPLTWPKGEKTTPPPERYSLKRLRGNYNPSPWAR